MIGEYKYEQAMIDFYEALDDYEELWRSGKYTYNQLQTIKDKIGHGMGYFSAYYGEIRAAAEQAKVDREYEYKLALKRHLEDSGGARGSVGRAETEAFIETKPFKDAEVKANKDYYDAKQLLARGQETQNNIATRLKPLLLIDDMEKPNNNE